MMLTSLLLLLLGQAPPAGGLSLEPPKGWQRFEDGQQRFYALLAPGVPPGQSCAVLVLVPLDFDGTEEEWHDLAVRNASQGSQVVGEVKKGNEWGASRCPPSPRSRPWGPSSGSRSTRSVVGEARSVGGLRIER
jgi:hypothetical protein